MSELGDLKSAKGIELDREAREMGFVIGPHTSRYIAALEARVAKLEEFLEVQELVIDSREESIRLLQTARLDLKEENGGMRERLRWRKFPEEPPPMLGAFLCQFSEVGGVAVLDYDDRERPNWSSNLGHLVSAWLPIPMHFEEKP